MLAPPLCASSLQGLQLGHSLLLQFCKRTERLYGKHLITPNMHLHMHLKSCIQDYGPLHGFWLYAFEGYNGPNNNRSADEPLPS